MLGVPIAFCRYAAPGDFSGVTGDLIEPASTYKLHLHMQQAVYNLAFFISDGQQHLLHLLKIAS